MSKYDEDMLYWASRCIGRRVPENQELYAWLESLVYACHRFKEQLDV